MNAFVNEVNRYWDSADPVTLAAYCLWRLNYIHPFINGNGRTARALCYYVVCVKIGGLPGGAVILPELIRQNRDEMVQLLQCADAAMRGRRPDALEGLRNFISRLLDEQIGGA